MSVDVIAARVAAREHEIVAFRRRLHANPELSGCEEETTAEIVERLRVAGLQPHVLRRGTGVVCDVPLGGEGPTVALRADIDALGMVDETTSGYASKNPGIAHACGHDVHTAVVLGSALTLRGLAHEEPGRWKGTVRVFFEPAEETMPGGALDIIEEGWLEGVQAVFGLHCDPKIDVGSIGLRSGPLTSASDLVEIELNGPGGHTARPHLTVDIVRALGEVSTRVPDLYLEKLAASGQSVLVFGAVHAGDAANVIPARGMLRGSARTIDTDAWERSEEVLRSVLAEVLEDSGAHWNLRYRRGVPPVVNDPWAIATMVAAGKETVGEDHLVDTPQSMGADSFAWLGQKVPAAYARLGTHRPGEPFLDLHASTFDVDEAAIGIGMRFLTATALEALEGLMDTDPSTA